MRKSDALGRKKYGPAGSSQRKTRKMLKNPYLNYYVRLFDDERFKGTPVSQVAQYAGREWRSMPKEQKDVYRKPRRRQTGLKVNQRSFQTNVEVHREQSADGYCQVDSNNDNDSNNNNIDCNNNDIASNNNQVNRRRRKNSEIYRNTSGSAANMNQIDSESDSDANTDVNAPPVRQERKSIYPLVYSSSSSSSPYTSSARSSVSDMSFNENGTQNIAGNQDSSVKEEDTEGNSCMTAENSNMTQEYTEENSSMTQGSFMENSSSRTHSDFNTGAKTSVSDGSRHSQDLCISQKEYQTSNTQEDLSNSQTENTCETYNTCVEPSQLDLSNSHTGQENVNQETSNEDNVTRETSDAYTTAKSASKESLSTASRNNTDCNAETSQEKNRVETSTQETSEEHGPICNNSASQEVLDTAPSVTDCKETTTQEQTLSADENTAVSDTVSTTQETPRKKEDNQDDQCSTRTRSIFSPVSDEVCVPHGRGVHITPERPRARPAETRRPVKRPAEEDLERQSKRRRVREISFEVAEDSTDTSSKNIPAPRITGRAVQRRTLSLPRALKRSISDNSESSESIPAPKLSRRAVHKRPLSFPRAQTRSISDISESIPAPRITRQVLPRVQTRSISDISESSESIPAPRITRRALPRVQTRSAKVAAMKKISTMSMPKAKGRSCGGKMSYVGPGTWGRPRKRKLYTVDSE